MKRMSGKQSRRPAAGRIAAAFLVAFSLASPARAQQVSREAGAYLGEIGRIAEEALAASRAAERAGSVEEVRGAAETVFRSVWGLPSGLTAGAASGAANVPGWKERWQVDGSEFPGKWVERYGVKPPARDPQELGIMGRALYVRRQLEAVTEAERVADARKRSAAEVITSLNNVIGWMRMESTRTKGETQPHVDLTREWDAPVAFWLSTADTGWLHEVYAQSLNILKADYGGDVAAARRHAADMTRLLERALNGLDADGDGNVEPAMMEGGLLTALRHAEQAGFLAGR